MRLEVNPAEFDAAVGEPVVLQVEVYNSRSVIDGYRPTLLGLPGQAFTSDPPELSLFPETLGVMTITFTPAPTLPAGTRVIGVKVASVIDPDESAAREVRLTIAPVSAATLTVEPLALTAGRRGEFSLAVANQGNVPLEAQLRGADSLRKFGFRFIPPVVALGPGETGVSKVVTGGRRPFFGSPLPHQLTFTAEGPPQPLQVASTFLQKPVVPRGILTLVSILTALAMWGAVLFLGVNKVADVAEKNREAEAAAAFKQTATGPFAGLPGGGGVLASVAGKITAAPDAKDATVSLIPVPSPTGGPAGEIPAPVTTPATGEYKVDKVASPGVYQIVFSKVGLGTQSRLVELKQGEQVTGIDVTLVAGSASISGTVSEAGGPVGGATVTADNGKESVTTVTSSSAPVGAFVLAGLPAAGTYAVSVAKEGFGTQTKVVEVAPNQKVTGLSVVVTQGKGSISGTVSNRAGAPVADVLVTVRAGAGTVPTSVGGTTTLPSRPLQPGRLGPDVLGAALTLADGPLGFYSVTGLATPGTYTVTFQKAGFVLTTATATLDQNGNENSLSPVIQPVTGVVIGTVTQDIARAVPCKPLECRLPEVQVKVVDRNGSEVRNTTSATSPAANQGRYEIAGLPPGTYTITFSKTGFVPQTFSQTLVDREPQRVLDVTLRGVTVPLTGSALNCTAVNVVLRNGQPANPPVTASVRPDGSYRIARVYSPGEYRVVFRGPAAPDATVNLDLDAGETDVVVDGICPLPPPPGPLDFLNPTTTTTTTATTTTTPPPPGTAS